jgi:hypothetical protein
MKYVVSLFRGVFCIGIFSMLSPWGTTLVEAALVTYQFTGSISEVNGSIHTPGGLGADGFDYGLTLSGRYTFDTTTPIQLAPPPPPSVVHGYQQGYYMNSVRASEFTIGNYASRLQTGGDTSIILGDRGAGYRVDNGILGEAVKGDLPLLFTIDLFDTTRTAFSSIDLPGAQPPSLSSFDSKQWRLVFMGGSSIGGSFDSLTAVPLPASFMLFGAGLLVLAYCTVRGRLLHHAGRSTAEHA